MTITKLNVVSLPSASEETKQTIIDALTKALQDAHSGLIDAILIVDHAPTNDWGIRCSVNFNVLEEVGALYAIAQERLLQWQDGDE